MSDETAKYQVPDLIDAQLRAAKAEIKRLRERVGDPSADTSANAYWRAKAEGNRAEIERLRDDEKTHAEHIVRQRKRIAELKAAIERAIVALTDGNWLEAVEPLKTALKEPPE